LVRKIYWNLNRTRRAIAMIELIFAITIMGIVLLSAPLLVNRSVASTYTALQQESIAAAATQISMIMTAAWDHNDTNATIGQPILRTVSGAAAVTPLIENCSGNTTMGVSSASGRYCKDVYATNSNFYTASAIALDSNFHDIDDFNGQTASVTLYNAEAYATYLGDYVDQNITITSAVVYGDDVPRNAGGAPSAGGYDRNINFSNPFRNSSATSTNIKLISVNLTSNNPVSELSDKSITLSAFMCNIGAPKELISNKAGL
jgi:type II secretory pathway pseudopilin PulG